MKNINDIYKEKLKNLYEDCSKNLFIMKEEIDDDEIMKKSSLKEEKIQIEENDLVEIDFEKINEKSTVRKLNKLLEKTNNNKLVVVNINESDLEVSNKYSNIFSSIIINEDCIKNVEKCNNNNNLQNIFNK